MATTKPDLDDYLERISAIQKLIIDGSQSSKYALPSGTPPYWLNSILTPRIRANTDNQSSMITYTCQMLLVRGTNTNVHQPQIEVAMADDVVDVLWVFMTNDSYRRLIVSTYTAIQPGFIPGSLKIVSHDRFNGIQGAPQLGDLLGTVYTLEWQHKMTRSIGS